MPVYPRSDRDAEFRKALAGSLSRRTGYGRLLGGKQSIRLREAVVTP